LISWIHVGPLGGFSQSDTRLGPVALFRAELERAGIVGKRREEAGGQLSGGKRFSRGALYLMLQNRLYRGEAAHKENIYPGQHEAIIETELWRTVQGDLRLPDAAQIPPQRSTSDVPASAYRIARELITKAFDKNSAGYKEPLTVAHGEAPPGDQAMHTMNCRGYIAKIDVDAAGVPQGGHPSQKGGGRHSSPRRRLCSFGSSSRA
jgi:hypothetical protein